MQSSKEIKSELRKKYRLLRKEMSVDFKKSLDHSICERLVTLPEYQNAETILVYSPCRGEIELNAFFDSAMRDGKKLAFPRCFDKEMRFSICTSDALVPGAYGILEPSIDAEYEASFTYDTTLCILPCLAADRSGFRLGYGGGYYDRFLSQNKLRTVAAVYRDFLTEVDFSEPFDIKADIIVTEEEIILS